MYGSGVAERRIQLMRKAKWKWRSEMGPKGRWGFSDYYTRTQVKWNQHTTTPGYGWTTSLYGETRGHVMRRKRQCKTMLCASGASLEWFFPLALSSGEAWSNTWDFFALNDRGGYTWVICFKCALKCKTFVQCIRFNAGCWIWSDTKFSQRVMGDAENT